MTATAYLALGSNLGDRVALLSDAVKAIAALPYTSVLAKSALYESPAWGSATPQPEYLNAVVAVGTELTAHELHRHTAAIEETQGRHRTAEKNASRTLDIDVLLYDDLVIDTPTLTIPHPRMHERDFVLLPLLDVAPGARIPGRGAAKNILATLPRTAIKRLGDSSQWI